MFFIELPQCSRSEVKNISKTSLNELFLSSKTRLHHQLQGSHTPFWEWAGAYRIGIDGWMTCDFTSFSTVFQSYQDDGQMIMKGCVQWNPVYG